jgi:hypothetical protein
MKHDRSGIEANDHSSRSKRHRLKLHHILIEQLDACANDSGVADLDNGDRRLASGDERFHHVLALRISDRRS